MNYYSNYQMYPYTQQQQVNLNGKLVDSAEMARISEVPIGGFGVFPKADLSEVYIKTWNNNGTTNIVTFRPVIEEPKQDIMAVLLERINTLETKIDAALAPKPEEPAPIRKEVKNCEY